MRVRMAACSSGSSWVVAEFFWDVGVAFVGVEDEHICADGEFGGEAAQDVEGGLAGAGFVASELGDVDADAFGEGGLDEARPRVRLPDRA